MFMHVLVRLPSQTDSLAYFAVNFIQEDEYQRTMCDYFFVDQRYLRDTYAYSNLIMRLRARPECLLFKGTRSTWNLF